MWLEPSTGGRQGHLQVTLRTWGLFWDGNHWRLENQGGCGVTASWKSPWLPDAGSVPFLRAHRAPFPLPSHSPTVCLQEQGPHLIPRPFSGAFLHTVHMQ